MRVGEVIRSYRKKKGLTQEEMADRLGVTAPAVNKWENGVSLPDITLLSPIARLLGVTPDILLSFHGELTEEKMREIVREMDAMFREKSYDEVFQWAKEKLRQYPDNSWLLWQLAVMLDAQRLTQGIVVQEEYEEYLCSLYVRALESGEEEVRYRAADSLFGYHMRRKEYEKAEEYLAYFSDHSLEKKRRRAQLYGETGRVQEACKAYEEILFSGYGELSLALHALYLLAVEENDLERAHTLVDKQQELARCFERGRYDEAVDKLDLATRERDADRVLDVMEELLTCVEQGQVCSYCSSPLYAHMKFKELNREFLEKLRAELLKNFRDREIYGFLEGNERWERLGNRAIL